MPIKPLLLMALLLIAAPAVWSAETAGEESRETFSAANQLLFLSDHLTDLDRPLLFHYVFEKKGVLEEGFTDSIDMTARAAADNSEAKRVDFPHYFSEKRRRPTPPVESARGNPIIMAFLQRDINEMERLTGGHWRYFQKRIKQALENDAEVKPVTFEYNGATVEGKRIRIAPYARDKYRGRMGDYADKYYEFTLSEAVPGDVYEMRTLVVATGKTETEEDNRVLMEEKLTLERVEPLDQKEASNN